ncbi:MAG: exo-alpha-sialidase [Candidatus Solibacter usitatus]|nr:exo-alpha-sialidase [Candidatus Solibacter usitatus]
MIDRRNLLRGGLVLLGHGARAALSARIESITTISHQPGHYHGWPTLARRRNGDLLVVCSGGREAHVCPFGRVELMWSHDDGRAWSWPEVLVDTPIDDRDAGACETSKGSLLVTTFTSLAYQAVLDKARGWPQEKLDRWVAVNRRIDAGQRESLLGTWMIRSTDGGLSWSAPYRVPVNSPHGPVAISDGRVLYAGKQLWEGARRIGVCESGDDGQSWRWLADIPTRPGDKHEDYHELHLVETADRRLLVHLRNHNSANAGETLQSESSDGGKTWTVPHPIGVWGLPSHLLRLRDGRLLMTYGHRRAPLGNQARVSRDHGRTWSDPLILSGDAPTTDVGYPSTVELPNGSLLTVWYEKMGASPQAVLRQARWSLEG